jgi:hypothetical protein
MAKHVCGLCGKTFGDEAGYATHPCKVSGVTPEDSEHGKASNLLSKVGDNLDVDAKAKIVVDDRMKRIKEAQTRAAEKEKIDEE